MSKALIIGEKPSVAADIARALGGFTKHQDYFESENYVLSSAVGHLLELKAPEEFDVKRGKWSFNNLPVIPPRFDLQPIERSEPRRTGFQAMRRTCPRRCPERRTTEAGRADATVAISKIDEIKRVLLALIGYILINTTSALDARF